MFTTAKPTDPTDDLLSDITVATNQSHLPGAALRPFAALMVKLADQTSASVADLKAHISSLNKANARLQGWVVALAVASLLGTIVQIWLALRAVPSSPIMTTTSPGGTTFALWWQQLLHAFRTFDFNVIGLVLGVIGAIVVTIFGMPSIEVLNSGAYVETTITPKIKLYGRLGRIGLALIVIGFIFQLVPAVRLVTP